MLPNDAIVSLCPQGTEILFALGLGGRVVGVTDMCHSPPEAAQIHIVSRCRFDSSKLTSAEVEQQLQMLAAEARAAPAAASRTMPRLYLRMRMDAKHDH